MDFELSLKEIKEINLKNINSMLIIRGFLTKQYPQKEYDKTYYVIKSDKFKYNYIVKFFDEKVTSISKIVDPSKLYKLKEDHIIFIGNKINPRAKKQLLEYPNTEIWTQDELMINILEHELQPEYELLSDEAAQSVLSNYRVDSTELPKILTDDPIVRYYKANVDQIFRIKRPSQTGGLSISYRVVINGIMNKK